MLNQKIKILFIPILLAASQLIATDKLLPSDDDLITPSSRVDSVSSASTIDPGNAFHRLMHKLRDLCKNEGDIQPWKNSILTFQRTSTDGDEMLSLESIRDRILGEPLSIRRKAMVEKAIKSLLNPTSAEPLSLISTPTAALIPALSLPLLPVDSLASVSRTSSLSAENPFKKRMQTLNFLRASNGKIGPWRDAISTFQRVSADGDEMPSLESIRDRILGEPLAIHRQAMVEKAFKSLLDPTPAEPLSLISAPTPALMPALSLPSAVSAPSTVTPPRSFAPFTIVFHPESRPRPTFRSERRSVPPSLDLDDKGELARSSIVEDHSEPVAKRSIPAPAIMAHMRQFIAGQDPAIEALSFLAHRFLCNKLLVDSGSAPASNPAHCILTGPTGCGKSESLKKLGEFLNVPILHINARSLTDEGFKGQNFSECVANFCDENSDPSSAIVAVDEIDKLGSRGDDEARNFGKAVQRVLLAPLDGSSLSLKGRRFNLANWWFVGTGAFSGLKGLHDTDGERTTTARTHKDIIDAGFEPEFVGRFSSIIPFKGHTIETMIDVISRDGSPLKKIQNEFRLFYEVNLTVEELALRCLAKTSIEINLGVRSLYTILNTALQPFYGQAMDLLETEADKVLTVTLKDITPAITKFKEDNKVPKEELPISVQMMYM